MFSLDHWMLKATKLAIFALALVGFVIYPSALYPDVFAKGLYVRVVIALALLGFLWLLAFRKIAWPRMTPLAWAVVIFFMATLSSMFFSASPYRSFWGEAQRMEGVFGLLHYGALFFIARAVFQSKGDWIKYFKVISLTAPLLVFYAILQYLSAKSGAYFPLVLGVSGNPGSFFGNPAFFSIFLIFAAGFSLLVYFMESSRAWRQFAVFSAGLSLATIFWLGIRGEALGVAGGALVFWALWVFGLGTKKTRRFFIVSIVSLAIVVAALAVFQGQLGRVYPNLLTRTLNLRNEPSFVTRWLSLSSSLKAWVDSPKSFIIGWGPEQFITGYNKYYNPAHGTYEDAWFDRAHSKLADVAVTTGLLGLMAYGLLFGVITFYLRRLFREERYKKIVVGAAALLVAYFAQNLAFFDLPHSYLNFFLLGAFIDSLVYREEAKKVAPEGSPLFFTGLAWAGTFLVLGLFIYTVFIPLRQSARYVYYFRTHQGNELFENLPSIFSPRNFVQYTLADDLWRRLQSQNAFRNPAFRPFTEFLIRELEDTVKREPYDAAMYLRLSDTLTEQGIGLEDQEILRQGEEYARQGIALSPGRQESYYPLAFNLQGQKRGEEAVGLMREAVALNPDTKKANYILGVNLALAGQLTEAIERLEAARKQRWFGTFQAADVRNLVKIYEAGNRQDLLIEFLMESLKTGIVRDQEYFVTVIRNLIIRQDATGVIYWANAYKDAYPEFAQDMAIIVDLAKKGAWETLGKL